MLLLRFSSYYPGIAALIEHANQIVNGGTVETIRGPIATNGTKGNNALDNIGFTITDVRSIICNSASSSFFLFPKKLNETR